MYFIEVPVILFVLICLLMTMSHAPLLFIAHENLMMMG